MTTAYIDPQSIHNPAAGSKPPATWGDTVRDDLEFLIAPPSVKCQRTTDYTSVTTGAWIAVPFDAADIWDTDGFHSTSTNNSRITIPAGLGGRYQFAANIGWDANTAGTYRQVGIRFGPSTFLATVLQEPPSGGYARQFVAVDAILSAGDYVEVVVSQDSGSTRTLQVDTWSKCTFSARWVSR